jgi:hypothetical protein
VVQRIPSAALDPQGGYFAGQGVLPDFFGVRKGFGKLFQRGEAFGRSFSSFQIVEDRFQPPLAERRTLSGEVRFLPCRQVLSEYGRGFPSFRCARFRPKRCDRLRPRRIFEFPACFFRRLRRGVAARSSTTPNDEGGEQEANRQNSSQTLQGLFASPSQDAPNIQNFAI